MENSQNCLEVNRKLFLNDFKLLVEMENYFPYLQSSALSLYALPLKIYFPDLQIPHLPF